MLVEDSTFFECNGRTMLVLVCFGLVLMQFAQQLGHTSSMAVIANLLMVVMIFCILYSVLDGPSERTANVDYELFVGQGDHSARYEWWNIINAFAVLVYCNCFNVIVVELMAEMEHPEEMHMVAYTSYAWYIVVYFLCGFVPVICWGGDLSDPFTMDLSNE